MNKLVKKLAIKKLNEAGIKTVDGDGRTVHITVHWIGGDNELGTDTYIADIDKVDGEIVVRITIGKVDVVTSLSGDNIAENFILALNKAVRIQLDKTYAVYDTSEVTAWRREEILHMIGDSETMDAENGERECRAAADRWTRMLHGDEGGPYLTESDVVSCLTVGLAAVLILDEDGNELAFVTKDLVGLCTTWPVRDGDSERRIIVTKSGFDEGLCDDGYGCPYFLNGAGGNVVCILDRGCTIGLESNLPVAYVEDEVGNNRVIVVRIDDLPERGQYHNGELG